MENTTQLSDGTNFKSILSSFIDYICNQFVSVPLMYNKLQGWYDDENQSYKAYIDSIGINKSKPGEVTNYILTD